MARFCGGIHLDDSLKIINGVICDKDASTVDVDAAVSTCGQLWDGALFTKLMVGGVPVISLHNSEGEDPGTPVRVNGNCGVGLDERHFKVIDGVVSLQDGFLLTVIADPDTAAITVMDADSTKIDPIKGHDNIFLLPDIGDQYSVTIQKYGYTGKSQTITNNGDQTLTIVLEEESQG